MLLWVALMPQSVAVSPPPGPAWGRAEQVATELRRTCLSEPGIAIALRDWSEGQAAARAEQPGTVAIERELGEAAYTAPINVERLERAMRARDANQARQQADRTRRELATLRRLSPEDRILYAQRFAVFRPTGRLRTCPERVR